LTKRVAVIPGDDAAPEAVLPVARLLQSLELDLELTILPSGEEGRQTYGDRFAAVVREAIESTDTVLFGASSGKTPALGYLRWGKGTYANVRPVRYIPGARSPLKDPEGIDYVIVRENMEDLYVGVQGDLSEIAGLPGLAPRGVDRPPLPVGPGKFALKVITEERTVRIAEFACRLALQRKAQGKPGKVTVSSKYNALPQPDGLFRRVAAETVARYPELLYEESIVDDLARRLVASPHEFDVVLLPNLYGDILSDEGAATIGGLGLAPSGCYGDSYAYFEPVHGTAPDIAGRHTINPTATLLSAAMMLDYLGFSEAAQRIEEAVFRVYREGRSLTPDQGGTATSEEFCRAVRAAIG
jgi:3-isopropylmalate dehydrogenase